MNVSRFFVDRPIFASVLSVIIVIVGFIAQRGLPVAEYPEIAPPTVNITATYPGASAEVIAETVATPIELEVNGVDDMLLPAEEAVRRANYLAAREEVEAINRRPGPGCRQCALLSAPSRRHGPSTGYTGVPLGWIGWIAAPLPMPAPTAPRIGLNSPE